METKPEERNQDKEIRRKEDKRRGIDESRKLVKERKFNKRMRVERKGKVRRFKLKIRKTCKLNDPKSYSINPTCYEKSTAVSRTKTDFDRCSKDNKKVNLVPENQPESSERQPADKKELRASLTAVKTGSYHPALTALASENPVVKTASYHPTLTALAENDDTTNADLDYR